MKAKIFYLESQKDLCHYISSLLRALVFKDIKIVEIEIEDNYNIASDLKMHDKCYEYLLLLKASILRIGDFSISIRDSEYKPQFYLGHPVGSWYHWYHWYHWYVNRDTSILDLEPSNFKELFPAIAIMDRFVIIPEKLTEVLESHPRNFLWCPKPLELGGAELVDVQDKNSWHKSISKLSVVLKAEIQKLCCRFIMAKRLQSLDFGLLSTWLNIDKNFISLSEHDIQVRAARLDVEILSGAAELCKTSLVTMAIQNHSNYPLKEVHIRVKGPHQTLPVPVSEYLSIQEKMSEKIRFLVKPTAAPFCPLEVRVDVGDDESIQPIIPTILNVKNSHDI